MPDIGAGLVLAAELFVDPAIEIPEEPAAGLAGESAVTFVPAPAVELFEGPAITAIFATQSAPLSDCISSNLPVHAVYRLPPVFVAAPTPPE